MFRQSGGLDINPVLVYGGNPSNPQSTGNADFRRYMSRLGVSDVNAFKKLPVGDQAVYLDKFTRSKSIDETSSLLEAGLDEKGLTNYSRGQGVMESTLGPNSPDPNQASPGLVSCKTSGACQRYSADDITYELLRRGYKHGGAYKYIMVHESELSPYETDSSNTIYKYVGPQGENPSMSPMGKRYSAPRKGTTILFQATKRENNDGEFYRLAADFNSKTTKPQLIKMLLASNKRIAKQASARSKLSSRNGSDSAKGAFPSETSNPYMYNVKSGLLKEQFLTIDHHGLTMFDYKGEQYTVAWAPFGANGGGRAKWVKKTHPGIGPNQKYLKGVFDTDSRGLPKMGQLNYRDHIGMLHQDDNQKVYQIQCVRKNPKNKSMAVSNCKKNKDGSIKLKWGIYDPELSMVTEAASRERQFITPLGKFTYDQLMKMPLDNILKMMIVLELMDESPKYAKKMSDLGVGPFSPDKIMKTGLGRGMARMSEGTLKTASGLTPEERMVLEGKFAQSGLPKCDYPEPPFRCYTDSFIPGTCVPDESMCFKPNLRKPWKEYMNRNHGSKMTWAAEASDNASATVTKKDLQDYYNEATQGSKPGDWLTY